MEARSLLNSYHSSQILRKDAVQHQSRSEEADWTVLFFLDGFSPDRELQIAESIFSLEKAGSDEQLQVVAQLGRSPQDKVHPKGGKDQVDGDWSGTRRFWIKKNSGANEALGTPEEWESTVRAIPENPQAHLALANSCKENGKPEEARKEFMKFQVFGRPGKSTNTSKIVSDFENEAQSLRDRIARKRFFVSTVLADLGQAPMGASQLKDFIASTMERFPSKHYMVVMSAHGHGWPGAFGTSSQSIAQAIQDGVQEANQKTDRNDCIDTLLFQSCWMGNLEALTEFALVAKTVVAPESVSLGAVNSHWDELLESIRKKVRSGTDIGAREMAGDIVEYFRKAGEENQTIPGIASLNNQAYPTLAAVDSEKVPGINAALNQLLTDWASSGTSYEKLMYHMFSARLSDAGGIPATGLLSRDLGDFMIRINKDLNLPEMLREDARKVLDALSEALLAEQHTGVSAENLTGISIWGPDQMEELKGNLPMYGKCVPRFLEGSQWDEFLSQRLEKTLQEYHLHS